MFALRTIVGRSANERPPVLQGMRMAFREEAQRPQRDCSGTTIRETVIGPAGHLTGMAIDLADR